MHTHRTIPYTLNIDGKLVSLQKPLVMGILNATAESFYTASRTLSAEAIANRALTMLDEGASIIDVGGCSTRPGLPPVSEEMEMYRLSVALEAIREACPTAILSVDTFRASIAERCVKDFGVHIINDISSGEADEKMFETAATLQVPYVLTHNTPHPTDASFFGAFLYDMAARVNRLHLLGVNDIIVDPGFGFSKTLDENYLLMNHLEELHLLHCPLLVGVSRKSMIYNQLECTPDEALNGTSVLHTIALAKGAHILRVHDVKAAVEATAITEKLKESSEYSEDKHNS